VNYEFASRCKLLFIKSLKSLSQNQLISSLFPHRALSIKWWPHRAVECKHFKMLGRNLSLVDWYAVAIGCLPFAFILYCLCHYFEFLTRIRFAVSNISSRLILKRRYWSSITFLEALLFSLYLVANGVLMVVGIHWSFTAFATRAGALSAVNMIPLFLGGRTNYLADSLGIPLHTYYLAHHWIGRVVILQSLLHLIPNLISRATRTVPGILVSLINIGKFPKLTLLACVRSHFHHANITLLYASIQIRILFVGSRWVILVFRGIFDLALSASPIYSGSSIPDNCPNILEFKFVGIAHSHYLLQYQEWRVGSKSRSQRAARGGYQG
jgi:hypothetical protein